MWSLLTSKEDKRPGMCPNCRETVKAQVVESNRFRRDLCECPNCQARILICRGAECNDYALGGDRYDDEYCEACFKKFLDSCKEYIKELPERLREHAENLKQQQNKKH
jgi:hypothetical protein